MSSPSYFCYSCNREVNARNTDLKCGECGGEFIEELQLQPSMRMEWRRRLGGNVPNPMNVFLQDIMLQMTGQQQGGAQRGGPHAPAPTPAEGANVQPNPMENPIQQFLNSLMGNLGQDVQIRFSINGQPGGIEQLSLAGNVGDYAWGAGGLDRIVTNLLNQFDASQTEQGLNEMDLARVPVISVTQRHVDNITQCTTCMETFNLDESVLELNCKHIFHGDCLTPWLERHRTCPICRQEIDPSQWHDQPVNVHATPAPLGNPLDELD